MYGNIHSKTYPNADYYISFLGEPVVVP